MGPPGALWALFTAEAGGALAAIMTALLVQKASSGPLELKDGDARLASWVLNPPRDWGLSMSLLPQVLIPLLIIGGWVWIPVRGPKRLIVGTDAFMISAPQALREFVSSSRSGETICRVSGRHLLEPAPRLCYEFGITWRRVPEIRS